MESREYAPKAVTRQPALWLGLLVVAYAVFFSWLTVQRHHAQLTTAYDMGIFDQILWNLTHGRGMACSIEASFSHWGVHTQPILYLLVPFYLAYPHPETLLVVQSVALALGAAPLYLVARRRTGRQWLALVVAGLYLLNPAIEGMNLIDFHPVALAPAFLLWAFYFLDTERLGAFIVAAGLAVACKEGVALVVAAMGFYALVVQRRPRVGVPTMALGLAWYFLAIGVWQPHVSGGVDKQGWRYEQLAWPLPALVRTLLTEPGRWIPYVLQPAKRAYLLGLLWPWGFLPLLAPQVSLIALPALMVNLLSSFAAQHEPDLYQYNAAIAPFLALGTASAMGWLDRRAVGGRRRLVVGLALVLLLGGGLSFHFFYGHTPLAAAFHPPAVTDHHAVRERLLREVPADAAISAQTTLVPHVSGRVAVWEYPMGLEAAEYVMLDVTAPHTTILLTADYYASIEALTAGGWGLVAAEDGYLLFRRDTPGMGELPEGFYRYALATGPGDGAIDPADFGPVRLVGVEVMGKREGWVDLTLTWQADEPVPAGTRPSIALGHSGGALTAWHRQDLPLGWETRGWAAGEVIRLTTGVGTGHGPSAGWGAGWTLYAGVIDDGDGVWLEPTGVVTRVEAIDGREASLVPVVAFENTGGALHAFRITDRGDLEK